MKKTKYLDEAFSEIEEELKKTFIRKHLDYGKGNILDTKELGIVFRISDKLNRLKFLLANQKSPQNETIDESWVDIAVYAVIAVLYRRGLFQKLNLSPKAKASAP